MAKAQHIRVCLVGYEPDSQLCEFETADGEVYHVSRKDVASKVFRVKWYASLFISENGEMKVRMD